MIKLLPTDSQSLSRSLLLYMRSDDASVVTLVRESTNKSITPSLDSIIVSNGKATQLDLTFTEEDLLQDEFYSLKVEDVSGDVIFKGKIFVTDASTTEDYSINQSEYVSYVSDDNDYITID